MVSPELADLHIGSNNTSACPSVVIGSLIGCLLSFCISSEAIAQSDNICRPREGSAAIVCGVNGGTSSQAFSPGSVIIMRQETLAFPGDLPNTSLPEESAAARDRMSFLANSEAGEASWYIAGFEANRDQAGTDRERGYSADRTGALAGLRLERQGYTLFLGIDASDESQDYKPGTFTRDRFPIPIPPARQDREDIGLSLGASANLAPSLVWHIAGRVGRIDVATSRGYYDLISTDGFIPPLSNIDESFVAQSLTEGTSIAAQTGISYGRALSSNFHAGISGSLLYSREKFDRFTEYLPDGRAAFTFGNDERTSFLSRIGVEVARPVRVSRTVMVPSIRAAWLHEFNDDSRAINVNAPAYLTGSRNEETDFTIQTNDPDRDYFTVGASVASLFAKGRGSVAIDYEAILGHDYIDEHLISVRLGVRF